MKKQSKLKKTVSKLCILIAFPYLYESMIYNCIQIINKQHKLRFILTGRRNKKTKKYEVSIQHTNPKFSLSLIKSKSKVMAYKNTYKYFLYYLSSPLSLNNLSIENLKQLKNA